MSFLTVTCLWHILYIHINLGLVIFYSPIGNPRAKSLLCVANIENRPALEKRLSRLATKSVSIHTKKNTVTFATRILKKNGQITSPKSSSTMFLNSKAGRANLDTKLPSPLACVDGMMFARPATYPQRIIPKHSSRAGRSLSIDMLGGTDGGSDPSLLPKMEILTDRSSILSLTTGLSQPCGTVNNCKVTKRSEK